MVRHIPCGTFVNESERAACEKLRAKLQGADGDWIILSNLSHAQHTGARADEIDLVVIGPPGVCTVEVKHWDAAYLRKDSLTV
ncbi:MAG TPA: nuclease-related domain-containing protein, partial [Lamprocystis sp. (in: g-proteobacteria)]|nr:nuclease-related domain-containing protein [Lamprocystis sp. (in: g-proteobacteria)]